tara:strand:+ start:184 stop:1251 length:1068 start_codon:yes stop_codon:yes gene_type:complete
LERNIKKLELQNIKTGVLLINLGTPDSPNIKDVRNYLRQLLSSNRVIDINPIIRWILLNLFILPFRPLTSSKAYKEIWSDDGSPLLINSQNLKIALAEKLSDEKIYVELGMQCGKPSIKNAIKSLIDKGCDKIGVIPLYPQYASSSFGAAIEDVYRENLNKWNMPFLQILPPIFSDTRFIEAWAKIGLPYLENHPDHIVFSFHGLPTRHLKKSDYSEKCCSNNYECCEVLVEENRYCYRAQCHHTTKLIAERLKLKKENWSISFQSRLGREEWIKPYTEQLLKEFAEKGLKRIVIFCPSFVADCLETIEEIGITAANNFRKNGGEELKLVPSLNNHPEWINALASIIRQNFLSNQ